MVMLMLLHTDFSPVSLSHACRYWGGDACYNAVKKGADDYYSYLAAGQYSKVSTDLGFSVSDFNDGIDAGGSCMIVPLSGIVEFNGINYADEPSVSKFCADFVSTTQASSAYNALIAFMKNRVRLGAAYMGSTAQSICCISICLL